MPVKWVWGLRVTIGYAAALVIVAGTLAALGPTVHDRVIRHASTNLHNLAHGRIGTLLGSAFVVDVGAMALWLPGLVCLLALAELLWRSRKLLTTFLIAHIGATLVIAAALAVAVHQGWMPRSITLATDVGMSYGAMGVLGMLTAAIRHAGARPGCAGGSPSGWPWWRRAETSPTPVIWSRCCSACWSRPGWVGPPAGPGPAWDCWPSGRSSAIWWSSPTRLPW